MTKHEVNRSRHIAACAAASLLLAASATASAQSGDSVALKTPEDVRMEKMINSTHVIAPGGVEIPVDTIRKRLNIFYIDQFRHFQDPRAPYFMLMSKDGQLAMGVGGMIRMRGNFDWNGSIPVNGFSPYLIPIPKDPTSKRRLWATPAGTGLFFTILGNNTFIGDFMGFIQCDFSGYNNRDFKLKKAYLQSDHWTIGYATTTFEDSSAEPPTIDGAGSNAVNSRTNVLVRYMTTFKDKWTVAGSLEFPSSSVNADDVYTKTCSDYVPDAAAFVQYKWNGGKSHVRLSGLGRVLTYRDLVDQRNYNVFGWAAQLSGVVKVVPQLNLMGIVSVGQGHASYTTDLSIGNYDLIARRGDKGRMYAPAIAGFVFGAQYYIKDNLFINMALSEQRFFPKHNPGDGDYKYGLYGAWNIFWDITPRFEVGAEYVCGKRMDFNGTHGSANRASAMFMFSF